MLNTRMLYTLESTCIVLWHIRCLVHYSEVSPTGFSGLPGKLHGTAVSVISLSKIQMRYLHLLECIFSLQNVCLGFPFCNISNRVAPARTGFSLFYPPHNHCGQLIRLRDSDWSKVTQWNLWLSIYLNSCLRSLKCKILSTIPRWHEKLRGIVSVPV